VLLLQIAPICALPHNKLVYPSSGEPGSPSRTTPHGTLVTTRMPGGAATFARHVCLGSFSALATARPSLSCLADTCLPAPSKNLPALNPALSQSHSKVLQPRHIRPVRYCSPATSTL
jgi:hypothetical protein